MIEQVQTQQQELQKAILKGEIAQLELVKYQEELNKVLEQKKEKLAVLVLSELKMLAEQKAEQPDYNSGDCYELISKSTASRYYAKYIGGDFWMTNYCYSHISTEDAEENFTITHMIKENK